MPEQSVTLGAVNKSAAKGERPTLSIALRDFGGINLDDARDAIGDNEFFWLENILPLAKGRLVVTPGVGATVTTIAGETGNPTLFVPFNVNGVNYGFAVWANSGNGWVGTLSTASTWTKIFAGTLTSGKTAATQFSNTGLLIVDAIGYFDWNVTTPGVVTSNTGQLDDPVIAPGIFGGSISSFSVHDPTGTGGTVGASTSVNAASAHATGSGYFVGDTLTAVGGTLTTSSAAPSAQQNQPLVLTVTSVNGTGAVTGFSIANVGYYQQAPGWAAGVPTGAPVPTTNVNAGTGFTFDATWIIGNPFIITPGQNYSDPTVHFSSGPNTVWYTVQTSGLLQGQAIAVYAGRVWIAVGRTVQFTDIDSYSSFGGVGGAFTIDDDYLHNKINVLYTANNYLYIMGDDSIDILSSVQVVDDVTSFSRVNAVADVGCDQPGSVYSHGRALMFANASGFWQLSGATPQHVSDKLEQVIAAGTGGTVTGGIFDLYGERCFGFVYTFVDTFTGLGGTRSLLFANVRGRWWFTSQNANLGTTASQPTGSRQILYSWVNNVLFPDMQGANMVSWFAFTKLWDAGAPMTDKFALNAAIAATPVGGAVSGLALYLQTWGSSTLTGVGNQLPNASGYQKYIGSAPPGGNDSVGLLIQGTNNTPEVRLIALQVQPDKEWAPGAN